MTVTWDDDLDAIFGGDLTAGLGYRTPAAGVVVQAVAPIGLRDRERGTLGFTTSLGFSKKLDRIAADPRVAMAFHARAHGSATGTRYVLAQGTARVTERPSDAQRSVVREHATEHLGSPKEGFFWDRWMREYYMSRVPVEVTVTRLLTWPTLDAAGTPEVVAGEPLPGQPAEPQRPPKLGVAPRIDVARAARRLRSTTHILLGYAGADGAPVVVPVELGAEDESGLVVRSSTPLPPGGASRRSPRAQVRCSSCSTARSPRGASGPHAGRRDERTHRRSPPAGNALGGAGRSSSSSCVQLTGRAPRCRAAVSSR